jgi:hypothetical protein
MHAQITQASHMLVLREETATPAPISNPPKVARISALLRTPTTAVTIAANICNISKMFGRSPNAL